MSSNKQNKGKAQYKVYYANCYANDIQASVNGEPYSTLKQAQEHTPPSYLGLKVIAEFLIRDNGSFQEKGKIIEVGGVSIYSK